MPVFRISIYSLFLFLLVGCLNGRMTLSNSNSGGAGGENVSSGGNGGNGSSGGGEGGGSSGSSGGGSEGGGGGSTGGGPVRKSFGYLISGTNDTHTEFGEGIAVLGDGRTVLGVTQGNQFGEDRRCGILVLKNGEPDPTIGSADYRGLVLNRPEGYSDCLVRAVQASGTFIYVVGSILDPDGGMFGYVARYAVGSGIGLDNTYGGTGFLKIFPENKNVEGKALYVTRAGDLFVATSGAARPDKYFFALSRRDGRGVSPQGWGNTSGDVVVTIEDPVMDPSVTVNSLVVDEDSNTYHLGGEVHTSGRDSGVIVSLNRRGEPLRRAENDEIQHFPEYFSLKAMTLQVAGLSKYLLFTGEERAKPSYLARVPLLGGDKDGSFGNAGSALISSGADFTTRSFGVSVIGSNILVASRTDMDNGERTMLTRLLSTGQPVATGNGSGNEIFDDHEEIGQTLFVVGTSYFLTGYDFLGNKNILFRRGEF